jgi:hypothetical protein
MQGRPGANALRIGRKCLVERAQMQCRAGANVVPSGRKMLGRAGANVPSNGLAGRGRVDDANVDGSHLLDGPVEYGPRRVGEPRQLPSRHLPQGLQLG